MSKPPRIAPLSVALSIAFGAATVASAANLVVNPGFDDDLHGWIKAGPSTITFSTADELGQPLSGSLEIRSILPQATSLGATQCVPVVAGKRYVYGAAVRFPAGQGLDGANAYVSAAWSNSADCSTEDGFVNAFGFQVFGEGVWGPTQAFAGIAPAGTVAMRLDLQARVATPAAPHLYVAQYDNAFVVEDVNCVPQDKTLCLTDDRFRVTVEFRTPQGQRGYGSAVPLTDDSGYFWFFNSTNVEMVVKLLDACPTQFNRFWYFAAGLTNVETVALIHDTKTRQTRTYTNPLGTAFQPVQDTQAFATCP